MKRVAVIALLGLVLSGAVWVQADDEGATLANTAGTTNLTAEVPKTKEQLAAEDKLRREKEKLQRQEDELNKAWSALPLNDKRNALDWYRGFAQLPAAERKSVRERVDRYRNMSKDEKLQLERNNERWAKMTPQERERARLEYLRLRYEYETRWRKEHPNEPPPPFRLAPPKSTVTTTNSPTEK